MNRTKEEWIRHVLQTARRQECTSIFEGPLAGSGTAVVLAPHPDDPDASAVFQRMLFRGGWSVRWIILTSGWSGVSDEFAGPSKRTKALVRRQEQAESARLFGLNNNSLVFMDLPETLEGDLADDRMGFALMTERLVAEDPDIAILPWGRDSNYTHRLVYEWFQRWRAASPKPVVAFLSEDPKSFDFAPHLRVSFDEQSARWKESLLECHRSQTQRNLLTRGHRFSDRILSMNRRAANGTNFYAERFRLSKGPVIRGRTASNTK